MPLTTEQKALVLKMWKYYDKHKEMIDEYKKTETKARAVENYGKIFPVKRARYERAWKGMPKAYEAKMSAIEERIKNWLFVFCSKMFGVTLTRDELDALYREIVATATAT